MAFQSNKHFSHPHPLQNLKLDEQTSFTRDACEEYIITTEPFHGCPSCDFHLHNQCFNSPIHIHHPSHPTHPLTLLPNPTHPSSRSFNCDACGFNGNGPCYNCSPCDFDIHLRCANLPMSLSINEHQHALRLFLKSPYNDGNIVLQCDICHGTKENKHWSYYCQECDFGTHVGCAMKFKETNYSGRHSSRDQEALDAAIIKAQIDAKSRRTILGHHRRHRRDGYYSSDSSDDGLI